MISNEVKDSIIRDICSLIGSEKPPKFLEENEWVELESGLWIISQEQKEFLKKLESEELHKKLKYAGIYIGKIRKNFGLSMESLYPLRTYITRYGIIKGKTLQKYLYGKEVIIQVPKDSVKNLELKKLIIMTSAKNPVGISSFTIFNETIEQDKTILHLQLNPITDLGMFLRNERTMFE